MSLPPATQAALVAFDKQLSKIEALMGPLEGLDLASAEDTLAPLEHAKLCATVAYSISSLFYMFLQTQGVAPAEHPIAKELARVQAHFAKIQGAEGPSTAAAAPSTAASGAAMRATLDKGAAGRFVNAHLKPRVSAAASGGASGGAKKAKRGATSDAAATPKAKRTKKSTPKKKSAKKAKKKSAKKSR